MYIDPRHIEGAGRFDMQMFKAFRKVPSERPGVVLFKTRPSPIAK